MMPSALTSVHPAPIDTLPGIEVTSAPPRASSWQLAQESPVACPLGARAGDDGRPSASICVAFPEKRGSKKNACPSATAPLSPTYRFDGSGGTAPSPVSECSGCHSTAERPQPAGSQNASSMRCPQPANADTNGNTKTTDVILMSQRRGWGGLPVLIAGLPIESRGPPIGKTGPTYF